jgi:hypothetical protein
MPSLRAMVPGGNSPDQVGPPNRQTCACATLGFPRIIRSGHMEKAVFGIVNEPTGPESQDGIHRLRERRKVQSRAFRGGVPECKLLTQDGLAAARHSDDQIDRVFEQATVEDFIQSRVATWKALVHRSESRVFGCRTRALVPSRSLIVETSCRGSSGFRKNAAAPARRASPEPSMEATARTCAEPLAANSPTSRVVDKSDRDSDVAPGSDNQDKVDQWVAEIDEWVRKIDQGMGEQEGREAGGGRSGGCSGTAPGCCASAARLILIQVTSRNGAT